MKDYAAVCLALSITGAVWWIITEYFHDALYKEHLRCIFPPDCLPLGCYEEIQRQFSDV